MQPTLLDDIPKLREELLQGFMSGKMRPIPYRKEQIAKLAYMVQDNIDDFRAALASDLGRNELEADFLDIQPTLNEILLAHKNVEKWNTPDKVPFSVNWFAMSPSIRKDPKGVVLIISPFNFPMLLILGPLAGAFAAGCTVVLKSSELSPKVSGVIAKLIPQYFDPDVCRVVIGSIAESTKLLELPWDHILYTGSGRVARVILTAAAKTLTSVTTEASAISMYLTSQMTVYAGKNPVVLDPKMDLKLAARRILWGKFTNCGQICASPDYLLLPQEIHEEFIKELLDVYAEFYPEGAKNSDSYARMATQSHAERMQRLISQTKGKIIIGGDTDVENRFVSPTIVTNVLNDDVLMEDELFGPILPILTVKNEDEAIQDHALTIYVFSEDAAFRSKVYDNTRSGAAIANDVVIYHSTTGLPFGGIGPSGSGGATTGKFNYDIFTHLRASLVGRALVDKILLKNRYPPHTAAKAKALAFAMNQKFPPRPKSLRALSNGVVKLAKTNRWRLWFAVAMLAAVASAAARLTNLRSLFAATP
ncbi:hypothetical protein EUX98_g7260 [Antrodiella citrinella]|uniref:Aldehyde dehydrogenase n=1 Tax=Antrodiella citrinella TaxID=2447956 RepID=A0A4S4MM04_9APHY|nr:hypothetical protein EUX98_g7260 [Antrodiella citrinella]